MSSYFQSPASAALESRILQNSSSSSPPKVLSCDYVAPEDLSVMVKPDSKVFKGVKNYKTRLVGIPTVYTGAAGGAILVNGDIPFTAAEFPELTQFGAVFDEVRIIKTTTHHKLFCNTSATAPGIVWGSLSLQYDPNQGNLATTYGALESTYNSGLIQGWSSTLVDQHIDYPMRSFSAPTKGIPILSSTCPGGGWVPVSTTSAVAFNFSGYIAAPSAVGVMQLLVRHELEVEFRIRI